MTTPDSTAVTIRGPQGPAGIGEALGAWDVATAYAKSDVVEYAAKLWRAKVASTGVAPGTDATKWETLLTLGLTAKTISASTYTVTQADLGLDLRFTVACTVSYDAGIEDDFHCSWEQAGAGQITFPANVYGFTRSYAQYARGCIMAGTGGHVEALGVMTA